MTKKKNQKNETEKILKYILYSIPVIIITALVFTLIEESFPTLNRFSLFIFIGVAGMILYIIFWKLGIEKKRNLAKK